MEITVTIYIDRFELYRLQNLVENYEYIVKESSPDYKHKLREEPVVYSYNSKFGYRLEVSIDSKIYELLDSEDFLVQETLYESMKGY